MKQSQFIPYFLVAYIVLAYIEYTLFTKNSKT